jgi:hypothetical protein
MGVLSRLFGGSSAGPAPTTGAGSAGPLHRRTTKISGSGEWRSVPGMPVTISSFSPRVQTDRFESSLATRSQPTFLAPLVHDRSAQHLSGVIDGIAVLVPDPPPTPPRAMPPATPPPADTASRVGVVQRFARRWNGSLGTGPADLPPSPAVEVTATPILGPIDPGPGGEVHEADVLGPLGEDVPPGPPIDAMVASAAIAGPARANRPLDLVSPAPFRPVAETDPSLPVHLPEGPEPRALPTIVPAAGRSTPRATEREPEVTAPLEPGAAALSREAASGTSLGATAGSSRSEQLASPTGPAAIEGPFVQRRPAGQTGRPEADAPRLTAPGPLPSAEPPSDAPGRATYRGEEATTFGSPGEAPSFGPAPSRAEPPVRRAFRLRIGSPISGEVETRSAGGGRVPTPTTTQREMTGAGTRSSSPPGSPETPVASQPGTQVTTPPPESASSQLVEGPDEPGVPLPVQPLETALAPPSAPGPGTAPTLGPSDLAERNDGPDRAPAPGTRGGLQAGAAHSLATGTPMVQKDGTAGSRSVPFPAGRAEAAPVRPDIDAPTGPDTPASLEVKVPGFPRPGQPYLPVTAPAPPSTSGTPEPAAAPPSPVSADFELTTDAAHGRHEEYEPSRPTEDISPEPGSTEAAPTLGAALNVQAKSAVDDGPDDERQVVERYASLLGGPHPPASVAPAPPETGVSSRPTALFSASSPVGSGPEPAPRGDGPLAAEPGGGPVPGPLSSSDSASSDAASSDAASAGPSSSGPASSVPLLSSPKGSLAGGEGSTAPDLQRLVVPKWQGRDVGMSGPRTASQPATANSPTGHSPATPPGHGTVGSPRARPSQPAQRQADASHPYETELVGGPTSFQTSREPMDLPAIAPGSGTASLVGGRLPDLVVARAQWSAASQPVSPVTPSEPPVNSGDPSLYRGGYSPVAYSSWPRGPVSGDVVQPGSLLLLSIPTTAQRAPATQAGPTVGPTLQFAPPGAPSSTLPPQPPVTDPASPEQGSPLAAPPGTVQRAGEAPAEEPSSNPAGGGASPPAQQSGKGGDDIDDLSRRLYDRIRDRLKAELYLDRERAGQLNDLTV